MHTHAVKPVLGAELALQVVHKLVVLPATEKVPAPQASMTALAVVEHCVVTRSPGPAVEHVDEQGMFNAVPNTEDMPAAE